jgi:hypothetical protein
MLVRADDAKVHHRRRYSMPQLRRPRRHPRPDRRRALELLASCRDGCMEAIMLAHGFTVPQMVNLVRAGLATAQADRVVTAGRTVEVARVRITEAGHRAAQFLASARCLALAAMCVLVSSTAWGQPDKVIYELKERCGRQAAETFNKEWGSNVVNSKDGQTVANFENHYNARLNKCFYLEISTTYERDKKPLKSFRLFDLLDNKEYATFIEGFLMHCQVGDRFCTSEAEWRELIRPFMED